VEGHAAHQVADQRGVGDAVFAVQQLLGPLQAIGMRGADQRTLAVLRMAGEPVVAAPADQEPDEGDDIDDGDLGAEGACYCFPPMYLPSQSATGSGLS